MIYNMVPAGLLLWFLLQCFVGEVYGSFPIPRFSFSNPMDLVNALNFFRNTIPKPEELFVADPPEVSSISMKDSPLVGYTTPEFIVHYGYHPETHYIATIDGYVLQMHRIKPRIAIPTSDSPREPVLIVHGIVASSDDWVMNPPSQSLAFMLVDAGYDVWLPNLRGNKYSTRHTTLDPTSKEFWQFSWHEIGLYDLPAIIDYVLSRTGFSKLHFVGHSMGTTSFFVMMDQYPLYNTKIAGFHAMAPVTAVDGMRSPFNILYPVLDVLRDMAELLSLWQLSRDNLVTETVATWFCADDKYTQFICKNTLFLLGGYNSKQLNSSMLPVYFAHTPAGDSMRCLWHYAETYQTGIFQPYLHDSQEGAAQAHYDLTRTTAPTYIYWGINDWLADPEDVKETAEALPNVKGYYQITDFKWSHTDFMWGIDANKLVYSQIIKDMESKYC